MNIPELKVMKDPEVFGEIFKVVKGPYCWGKPYLDLEARSKGKEEGNLPSGCTEAVFNLSKFFVINAFRLPAQDRRVSHTNQGSKSALIH